MTKLFSVIIPTCDRPFLLIKCLDSIISSVRFADLVEDVIISDDSIGVETKSLIESYSSRLNVLYTCGPKKGPAANRNNGAKYATAKWLIFLDDDIYVTSQIFESYKIALETNFSGALEGAIFPDDEEELKKEFRECPVNKNGGLFWSANIAIKKDLFLKLGGFDEFFPKAANEDQELYHRLSAEGDVPFVSNAIVIHPVKKVGFRIKLKNMYIDLVSWIHFKTACGYSNRSIYFEALKSQALFSIVCLKRFHLLKSLYHMIYFMYSFYKIPKLVLSR